MAGILYHGQHGVAAQRNEAIGLYRAGALRGDANSMYNLGVLHLRVSDYSSNYHTSCICKRNENLLLKILL